MKSFLTLFSYIFHPIFISVYALLFYFGLTAQFFDTSEIYLLFIQIVILTVFLPVCAYYLLKLFGLIKGDVMVNDVKERSLPLAIQSIYFLFIYKYVLRDISAFELKLFFIAALASTCLALFCSLIKFKISLHMIGISGLVTFFTLLCLKYNVPLLYFNAFMILCMGGVASSRLSMKAHKLDEIALGTLGGILPQLLVLYLL